MCKYITSLNTVMGRPFCLTYMYIDRERIASVYCVFRKTSSLHLKIVYCYIKSTFISIILDTATLQNIQTFINQINVKKSLKNFDFDEFIHGDIPLKLTLWQYAHLARMFTLKHTHKRVSCLVTI